MRSARFFSACRSHSRLECSWHSRPCPPSFGSCIRFWPKIGTVWAGIAPCASCDSIFCPSGDRSHGRRIANDNGAAEAAPYLFDSHGAPRRNRTSNLLIKSPQQSPTQQHLEDLNSRKTEPEGGGELS